MAAGFEQTVMKIQLCFEFNHRSTEQGDEKDDGGELHFYIMHHMLSRFYPKRRSLINAYKYYIHQTPVSWLSTTTAMESGWLERGCCPSGALWRPAVVTSARCTRSGKCSSPMDGETSISSKCSAVRHLGS